MEKYKIIENRPGLTSKQINEGMDFNKIKSNAALAKSSLLKVVFIKGILGVLVIAAIAIAYKNYTKAVVKNQVVTKTSNTTTLPKSVQPVDYTTETNVKTITPVIEHTIAHKHGNSVSPPIIDCVATNPMVVNDPVNTDYNNSSTYKNEEFSYLENRSNTTGLSPLTTADGSVDMKAVNKSLARVADGLYASKYEVTNKLYTTFLNSLKKYAKASLLAVAKIDTLKWLDRQSYNAPYADYYHAHAAYQNYPVVNISYEGAKLFCDWLTDQYNTDPDRKFKKVRFRLPSEEEWIIAAQAGNSGAYSWKGKEIDDNGSTTCNFKRESNILNSKDKYTGDITTPVNAYSKNGFGIYNMCGNVAEMIDEKGIVKGGSWRDGPEFLKIESYHKYDGKPQAHIGFRYFMEIIEK